MLPVPENLPLTAGIGIIVLVLIGAAVYFLRKYRRPERTVYHEDEQPDFDYHTAIKPKPIPVPPPAATPKPVPGQVPPVAKRSSPSPRAGTSVVEGYRDITECLGALVRKFSLDSFTLATCDGLVFASSGGDNAPADAARYSEIFMNDPLSETPGVILFGVHHTGSSLVGIIRTPQEIPGNVLDAIEHDTKDILNRWI